MYDKVINPNPKVLNSMRASGYNIYTALCDLIDNSIDAKEEGSPLEVQVNFDIVKGSEGQTEAIHIVDNGRGMGAETLNQALRLGSDTHKELVSDLGWFGMGLTTASISQGKRIEVLTKTPDGPLLFAAMDLDHIEDKGKFELESFGEATDSQKAWFGKSAGYSSGTIVSLKKLDRLSNKNKYDSEPTLIKTVGRVYRKFLSEGQYKISINGKAVNPSDPLFLNDANTVIHLDQPVFIKGLPLCHVKLVTIPSPGHGKRQEGIGVREQGFSVVRNNREIAMGSTLESAGSNRESLWGQKHGNAIRLRGEISFSGDVDALMGIDFGKRTCEVRQAAFQAIKQAVKPTLSHAKNLLTRAQKKKISEEMEPVIDQIETDASKKAKLLELARVAKEKGKSGVNKKRPVDSTKEKRRSPKNTRIKFTSMTHCGPLYATHMEGTVTVLEINTDHAFYDRITSVEERTYGAIIQLLLAMAQTENKYLLEDEDKKEFFDCSKITMSNNLRVLLS